MSSTRIKKYTKDQSSNVAEISYNPEDGSLEVEFHIGKRYRYLDVPVTVFDAAISAPSVGSFVSKHIVGVFNGVPLDKRNPQGVDV